MSHYDPLTGFIVSVMNIFASNFTKYIETGRLALHMVQIISGINPGVSFQIPDAERSTQAPGLGAQ